MSEDIKVTVANNLTALRKSRNMTQADVAKALNYSDKSVSKWEHADSLPDIAILSALCDMYGVTLDYLTHADPKEQAAMIKAKDKLTDGLGNRITIILMAITSVYMISTVVFVYSILYNGVHYWQAFLWGVPASALVLLYFNKIWMKGRYIKTLLLTLLCWSSLLCVYFLDRNLWLVFILGIPVQIIILLASQLGKK